MAFALNQVTIIGNLVRDFKDDDVRKVTPKDKDETQVVTFPVAVSGAGNDREQPGYFNVTCWGKNAVNCAKYLGKGSKVAVTGQLRQSSWLPEGKTDKADTEYRIGIANCTVHFLDSANGNGSSGPGVDETKELAAQAQAAPAAPEAEQAPGTDDGIPF